MCCDDCSPPLTPSSNFSPLSLGLLNRLISEGCFTCLASLGSFGVDVVVVGVELSTAAHRDAVLALAGAVFSAFSAFSFFSAFGFDSALNWLVEPLRPLFPLNV